LAIPALSSASVLSFVEIAGATTAFAKKLVNILAPTALLTKQQIAETNRTVRTTIISNDAGGKRLFRSAAT
jgi:hypothetical protein